MGPICAALVIPHRLSSPIRIDDIDHDLVSRQVLVEGNIKVISYIDWLVYLNDEAEVIPLPLNLRAEVLIREAGVPLEAQSGGPPSSSAKGPTDGMQMYPYICFVWPNASSSGTGRVAAGTAQ